MWALHRWLPAAELAWPGRVWAGWVLFAAGSALAGWGSATLVWHRTTLQPGRAPSRLVCAGPFRFSRNPVYLGMVVMLAGIALVLGSLSPWTVIPLFIWLVDRRIIRVEEATMRETFGAAYERYCTRVRRWAGVTRRDGR
jgi:protein-S-isoprenylcysteine O-methyltransferase Ste14